METLQMETSVLPEINSKREEALRAVCERLAEGLDRVGGRLIADPTFDDSFKRGV